MKPLRRLAVFVAFCAVAMAVPIILNANPSVVAETELRFLGPFWSTPMSFDSTTGGQVGGEIRTYISGDTARVGEVVYISANNTINKSTSTANHEKIAGVVVGGRSTSMRAKLDSADVGLTAALPNRPVLILRVGRTWVRMDTVTATDTLHAGQAIKPSTLRAGYVMGVTAFTDSANGSNRIFGRGVRLAVKGVAGLAEINAK